jgi:hypothetical protein
VVQLLIGEYLLVVLFVGRRLVVVLEELVPSLLEALALASVAGFLGKEYSLFVVEQFPWVVQQVALLQEEVDLPFRQVFVLFVVALVALALVAIASLVVAAALVDLTYFRNNPGLLEEIFRYYRGHIA